MKDKAFKYIGKLIYNKKKKINQNNSIKIDENKKLKDLSYFNTFINKTTTNFIPLDENEEYDVFGNKENSKKYDFSSIFGNDQKIFNQNSQISFTDLHNNNDTFFQLSKPKMNFSKLINSPIDNKGKSFIPLEYDYQNITQYNLFFPYNKSINSIYSNKKRKRSPNNCNNESKIKKDSFYFSN